jgi:hypothetical protein
MLCRMSVRYEPDDQLILNPQVIKMQYRAASTSPEKVAQHHEYPTLSRHLLCGCVNVLGDKNMQEY